MMPDLGKYAQTVMSSYVATLVLLALMVLIYVTRYRAAKRALAAAEAQKNA